MACPSTRAAYPRSAILLETVIPQPSGDWIEWRTPAWAARCTTVSNLPAAKNPLIALRSTMSRLTNRKSARDGSRPSRACFSRTSYQSFRLSMPTTSSTRSCSRCACIVPMKPAVPVARTFTRSSSSNSRSTHVTGICPSGSSRRSFAFAW